MRRNVKRPGVKLKAVCVLLLVIALLFGMYCAGRWLEKRMANPEPDGDYRQHITDNTGISYGRKTYRLKKNLTSVLLLGIDYGNAKAGDSADGGRTEFVQLLVIDDNAQTVKRLQIDSEAIITTDAPDTHPAHDFASDSKEQYCKLSVEAVSSLLLSTPIDFYIAVDLDGIGVINDLADGVTVTLKDDFSALDPAMTKGTELTLNGNQAEIYFCSKADTETRKARTERQEQYAEQLFRQIKNRFLVDKDFLGAVAFFDGTSEYLTTNITRGRLLNEAYNSRKYVREELTSLHGKCRIGTNGLMRFHADEKSLYETVLDLFYEEVK